MLVSYPPENIEYFIECYRAVPRNRILKVFLAVTYRPNIERLLAILSEYRETFGDIVRVSRKFWPYRSNIFFFLERYRTDSERFWRNRTNIEKVFGSIVRTLKEFLTISYEFREVFGDRMLYSHRFFFGGKISYEYREDVSNIVWTSFLFCSLKRYISYEFRNVFGDIVGT